MVSLDWCRKQKRGIKLVKPNLNLFKEYIDNAEESIRVIDRIEETKSNMWLATTKYYIEYFTAYAFLMRVGIKSEIHDCTIELLRKLERENIIDFKISERLEADKVLRIDNQYYLKNRPVTVNLEELRELILTVKKVAEMLTPEDIEKIRKVVA